MEGTLYSVVFLIEKVTCGKRLGGGKGVNFSDEQNKAPPLLVQWERHTISK